MKVEPPSDLRQAAAASFQMFTAYVDAGFTEDQAIKLIIGMVGGATPSE